MKIAVNGYFFLYPYSGQGRYLREIIKYLKNAEVDLFICSPSTTNKIVKIFFEQIFFPFYCWRHKVDLAFVPYFGPPLFSPVPVATTVHDLVNFIFPLPHPWRGWYNKLIARALKKSRVVLVDTPSTREDLVRQFSLPPEKIVVVPLGVDPTIFQYAPEVKRENFLLWVGNDRPHKNLHNLLAAWSGPGALPVGGLVLVGVTEQKLSGKIRCLSRLSDQGLVDLYQRARALCIPSLKEGFGLPALEAAACGCPVVAADIPPLREILGEAGIYVDPKDSFSIAEGLRRALGMSETERQNLSLKLCTRARQFTWEKTGELTLRILKRRG